MRRFADSDTVPTAAQLRAAVQADKIEGWAGYLPSPYADNPWSPAQLSTALRVTGALLPVYVAPYNGDTLSRMDPKADAERAAEGLSKIKGAHKLDVIAFDYERAGWDASPQRCREHFAAMRHAPELKHVDCLPYGAPPTCLALGVQGIGVWVAEWFYSSGHPAPPWPKAVTPHDIGSHFETRRAWQFSGQTQRWGLGVDLNVATDSFPFLIHRSKHDTPTPKPSPSPHPKAHDAKVTIEVAGQLYSGSLPASHH